MLIKPILKTLVGGQFTAKAIEAEIFYGGQYAPKHLVAAVRGGFFIYPKKLRIQKNYNTI